MKPIIYVVLFMSFWPSVVVADTIKVVVLTGQSNADGRAVVSELPMNLQSPQSDVSYFFHSQGTGHPLDSTLTTLRPGTSETGQFGPEITFGSEMANYFASEPDTSVAIIKYANGATSLAADWRAGGDASTAGDGGEYLTLHNTVSAGLAALQTAYPDDAIEMAGMLWMQGERDTKNDTDANTYQINLTNFIQDVRATYGTDLPFIIGRLSSGQTVLDAERLQTVMDAQTWVANNDPIAELVDTDLFSMKSDHLHFDSLGQMSLGSAFATKLQSLLHNDLTGDLNGDGILNQNDIDIFTSNWMRTFDPLDIGQYSMDYGDLDQNGVIDQFDWGKMYLVFTNAGIPINFAFIPEPASIGLLCLGSLLVTNRRSLKR